MDTKLYRIFLKKGGLGVTNMIIIIAFAFGASGIAFWGIRNAAQEAREFQEKVIADTDGLLLKRALARIAKKDGVEMEKDETTKDSDTLVE